MMPHLNIALLSLGVGLWVLAVLVSALWRPGERYPRLRLAVIGVLIGAGALVLAHIVLGYFREFTRGMGG